MSRTRAAITRGYNTLHLGLMSLRKTNTDCTQKHTIYCYYIITARFIQVEATGSRKQRGVVGHTGGRGGCFWSEEGSATTWSTSWWDGGTERMRGASLASSSSSLSSSPSVDRLMQEQRSREAKKAEVTLDPTQLAQLSMADGDLLRLLARVSFSRAVVKVNPNAAETGAKRSRRGGRLLDGEIESHVFLPSPVAWAGLALGCYYKTCFSFSIFFFT
jgi:hypothetical protein